MENRYKRCRLRLGLSIQEVADYVNISTKSMFGYENQDNQPRGDILLRLSTLYEVSTDYLLGKAPLVSKSVQVMDSKYIFSMDDMRNVELSTGIEAIPYDLNDFTMFGLRVRGFSMDPVFPSDCAVLCKEALEWEPDNFVAVITPNQPVRIRKVSIHGDIAVLTAVNQFFPTEFLPKDDIIIMGVVKEIRRRV